MTPESNLSPPVETGVSVTVPTRLTRIFEEADTQIRAAYGLTPGVEVLIRLWLASSTASRIRTQFEDAVLDIKKRSTQLNVETDLDDELI